MIRTALEAGQKYILRARLYFKADKGDIGIMYF